MTAIIAAALGAGLLAQQPDAAKTDPVGKGLRWLAQNQKADGTWDSPNGFAPTNVTATAGLALLMEGSTPRHGRYAPHIRRTLGWVEASAGADGQLAGSDPAERGQYIPAHAHALLFLACAYDTDDDDRRKRLAKLIERGVSFLAERQTARGGWGYAAPREASNYDDTPSTTTALQALLAARKAGFDVPPAAVDRGFGYLTKATDARGGVVTSLFNNPPAGVPGVPSYSAGAAACAMMRGAPRTGVVGQWVASGSGPTATQQTQYLRGNPAYALIALWPVARMSYGLGDGGHRKLDPDLRDDRLFRWSAYRPKLFKAILDIQTKDGNWADPSYGPAYPTALALLILQLDNDYLPAFAR
ncbi:MAG: terpene cyclase/mutase family protein [Gemmataceae bacterium]|nr:terpene cyclase/mutase family protein [Gemmataceae bacterium]